jgi:hypothetical protein
MLIIDSKHMKKKCKDKIGCITTIGSKKPTVSMSSEVNSLDFICLFSSVWLIKLICASPCIFNAFDFKHQISPKDNSNPNISSAL